MAKKTVVLCDCCKKNGTETEATVSVSVQYGSSSDGDRMSADHWPLDLCPSHAAAMLKSALGMIEESKRGVLAKDYGAKFHYF